MEKTKNRPNREGRDLGMLVLLVLLAFSTLVYVADCKRLVDDTLCRAKLHMVDNEPILLKADIEENLTFVLESGQPFRKSQSVQTSVLTVQGPF